MAVFHWVIDELRQPPEQDTPVRARNNHSRREELTDLHTANAAAPGQTAYLAERAITEYADRRKVVRPTGSPRNKLAARATAGC